MQFIPRLARRIANLSAISCSGKQLPNVKLLARNLIRLPLPSMKCPPSGRTKPCPPAGRSLSHETLTAESSAGDDRPGMTKGNISWAEAVCTIIEVPVSIDMQKMKLFIFLFLEGGQLFPEH